MDSALLSTTEFSLSKTASAPSVNVAIIHSKSISPSITITELAKYTGCSVYIVIAGLLEGREGGKSTRPQQHT